MSSIEDTIANKIYLSFKKVKANWFEFYTTDKEEVFKDKLYGIITKAILEKYQIISSELFNQKER